MDTNGHSPLYLLERSEVGVVQLDRALKVVAMNDFARRVLAIENRNVVTPAKVSQLILVEIERTHDLWRRAQKRIVSDQIGAEPDISKIHDHHISARLCDRVSGSCIRCDKRVDLIGPPRKQYEQRQGSARQQGQLSRLTLMLPPTIARS